MINFQTFQSNCKYAQYGLKQNTVRDFELTCRKSEYIPNGFSWGVCDEIHCPHFGIEINGGEMINQETGNVMYTFGRGRIVFGK